MRQLRIIITAGGASKMSFIHENPNWPKFTWDSDVLSPVLASLRYREGLLIGRMQGLGFHFRQEANLKNLTSDIVKSSAIEGENLSPEEVRSSVARRLGLDIGGLVSASRKVEGVVEMMVDATQNFAASLTAERLFDWHAALFPTGISGMQQITVGTWRPKEAGTMQVVSGPIGREKVHFEAPAAVRLITEMEHFLDWFNQPAPIDAVLKAGVVHFWFVTIHPFEDGNGRIARAIADMALARADGSKERFYSMSSQIEAKRKAYYAQLEAQQRGGLDITPWLSWFLDCLDQAFDSAEATLESVHYKAKLWEQANQLQVNERQRLVINRMLEDGWEGFLNTSKYAKLAKCSTDTALRDIQELLAGNILVQNPGGGRSTSYQLIAEDGLT